MQKEKRGVSAFDGMLILLILLASVGFVYQFVLSDGLNITGNGPENEPKNLSLESISPKDPVNSYSWTSGILEKGAISFNVKIESEKAVKIGIYRVENGEMISIYEKWKYPPKDYPYKISSSISLANPGETPESGKYVLLVRNTENEKILQEIRDWKRGKPEITIDSASSDGKISMELYWGSNASDKPKKELNLIIGGLNVYVNGGMKKIKKVEFRAGSGDWHEFSKNRITALGHPWQFERRYIRIYLNSGVEKGSQPTKIVFKDAHGNEVLVCDQNIAYL